MMSCASTTAPFACALDAWIAKECAARSPEELLSRLTTAQWRALARTLRHAAKHSTFYAHALCGHDLAPHRSEDLAQLPFTLPQDLSAWETLLCTSLGDVQRLVTMPTSGTTGMPKRLAFTQRDLERIGLFFAAGMSYLVKPGSSVAVLLPGAQRPNGVADLLRQALVSLDIPVACPPPDLLHKEQTSALAAWLRKTAPSTVVAMPTQLQRLFSAIPQGLPCLSGVLSSAEPLDVSLGTALRSQWNCELLDHYGLTEAGYGCALECPSHDGYHLRAMDIFVEIVSPDDGHLLPVNAVGEIVITTLDREAMPLIRYRTGDMSSLLSEPCTCGSPLPRLGPILGRIVRDASGQTRILRLPKREAAPC